MAVGAVIDTHKMRKHCDIAITETSFSCTRKTDAIAAEAATDGRYIVRTSLATEGLNDTATGRSDKSLSQVERAFRCLKTVDLQRRPVHHWQADRVRAPVFLCRLAYYLEWHMRQALAPLLFDATNKADAGAARKSVVAKAQRSRRALRKQTTAMTPERLPVHSCRTWRAALATLRRNSIIVAITPGLALCVLAKATPVQRRACALPAVVLEPVNRACD